MKITNKQTRPRGFVVLASVFAMAIFTFSVFVFFGSLNSTKKTSVADNKKVVAEFYASELLELLLSRPSAGLRANLSPNPVSASLPGYKVCSHINLLDRSSGVILNRDPLAALPAESPLQGVGAGNAANRFYMVQVIDLASLNPRKDLCNTAFSALPPLGLTERLYITVGVSWVEKNDVRRVAVSAAIP